MSWSQYAEAATSVLATKLGLAQDPYTPDYTKSLVDHFAIHAGVGWGAAPCGLLRSSVTAPLSQQSVTRVNG